MVINYTAAFSLNIRQLILIWRIKSTLQTSVLRLSIHNDLGENLIPLLLHKKALKLREIKEYFANYFLFIHPIKDRKSVTKRIKTFGV